LHNIAINDVDFEGGNLPINFSEGGTKDVRHSINIVLFWKHVIQRFFRVTCI